MNNLFTSTMTNNNINEKIERFKIKSKIFIKNNSRVFIEDLNGSYFFCTIKEFDIDSITFIPFKKNNAGEVVERLWADIIRLDEYKEVLE